MDGTHAQNFFSAKLCGENLGKSALGDFPCNILIDPVQFPGRQLSVGNIAEINDSQLGGRDDLPVRRLADEPLGKLSKGTAVIDDFFYGISSHSLQGEPQL